MFERIAYSTDLGEITLIRALLQQSGLHVPELQHSPHVSLAGVDHGYYVHVLAVHADRARRLLADSEFRHCVVA